MRGFYIIMGARRERVKQFLDNHQESSILALTYHDALLFCIFFPFYVYVIENVPFCSQLPGCAVKVELIYLSSRG